jgi:hypothetical protein
MDEVLADARWEDIEAQARRELSAEDYVRLRFMFRVHEVVRRPMTMRDRRDAMRRLRAELGLKQAPEHSGGVGPPSV